MRAISRTRSSIFSVKDVWIWWLVWPPHSTFWTKRELAGSTRKKGRKPDSLRRWNKEESLSGPEFLGKSFWLKRTTKKQGRRGRIYRIRRSEYGYKQARWNYGGRVLPYILALVYPLKEKYQPERWIWFFANSLLLATAQRIWGSQNKGFLVKRRVAKLLKVRLLMSKELSQNLRRDWSVALSLIPEKSETSEPTPGGKEPTKRNSA